MIRIRLKSGVLGVLGVPEPLQPSNGAGFSDGTQFVKGGNTGVQNTVSVPMRTSEHEHVTSRSCWQRQGAGGGCYE